MNPHLAHEMVNDRRREVERAVRNAQGALPARRRGSIVRLIGLAMMRTGRRLAGPDQPADRRDRAWHAPATGIQILG